MQKLMFICFLLFGHISHLFANEENVVIESDFFQVLWQIEDVYKARLKNKGIDLQIHKNWSNEDFNSSSLLLKDRFIVTIPGGLARLPFMSVDAVAFAACHEIGHYLGGAPKVRLDRENFWSSVEGQADYFVAAKCLRSLFNDRSENRAAYLKLPSFLREQIKNTCTTFQCARIVAAGWSILQAAKSLSGSKTHIFLEKKEKFIIKDHTLEVHPSLQCRLDTIVAGANCPISSSQGFDDFDPAVGACMHDGLSEMEVKTARPLCWYFPNEII